MKERRSLTVGFRAGYAGGEKPKKVNRGTFQMKSLQPELDGVQYIDQWIGGSSGGGQEIAQGRDGNIETRLYGGGVVEENLEELGITKEDVDNYRAQKLKELPDRTRLEEEIELQTDGDWQYGYKLLELPAAFGKIPLKMAIEFINYRRALVFAHGFILTKVKNYKDRGEQFKKEVNRLS